MPRAPLTEVQVSDGRRRIVDAALKIIGSEGFEALSMRSLADVVGLTPGALYRYFASKDEVMDAVFGGGNALDDRLLEAVNRTASDIEAVRMGLATYAEFAFEDDVRFRALYLRYYGPVGHAFHAGGARRPGAEAVKQRIQSAMDTGAFRKMDANLAFQVLWGAIHGVIVVILTAEGYPFATRSQVVDAAIDNALRGMTNPNPNPREAGDLIWI